MRQFPQSGWTPQAFSPGKGAARRACPEHSRRGRTYERATALLLEYTCLAPGGPACLPSPLWMPFRPPFNGPEHSSSRRSGGERFSSYAWSHSSPKDSAADSISRCQAAVSHRAILTSPLLLRHSALLQDASRRLLQALWRSSCSLLFCIT